MRKYLPIGALLIILAACAATIMPGGVTVVEAQTLPSTKTLEWTPNDPAEQVQSYVATYDGVALPQILTESCTTTCSVPFTITSQGPHTLTVKAVNQWGEGPIASLDINVQLPKGVTGVKIKK